MRFVSTLAAAGVAAAALIVAASAAPVVRDPMTLEVLPTPAELFLPAAPTARPMPPAGGARLLLSLRASAAGAAPLGSAEVPSPGPEPSPGVEVPSPGAELPFPGEEVPSPGAEVPSPGPEVPSPSPAF